MRTNTQSADYRLPGAAHARLELTDLTAAWVLALRAVCGSTGMRLLMFIGAVLLWAAPAHANVCVVNSLSDLDVYNGFVGTLRGAMNTASCSEIQITAHGTIDLATSLPDITRNLTITGPGPDKLTIHCYGTDYCLIFRADNYNRTMNISGMTLTNANTAVSIAYGTLTVSNVTFDRNRDGISNWNVYGYGGTLNVSNSTFSFNTYTSISNGATPGRIGIATVSNCTFANNGGNAIFNDGTLTVTGSSFTWGGASAIYSRQGDVTISDTTFSTNHTASSGGAIFAGNDGPNRYSLNITNSTFKANSADISGGAIDMWIGTIASITGSAFSFNFSGAGGAISNGGELTLLNSTFAFNKAYLTCPPQTCLPGAGGAIATTPRLIVEHSTFYSNVGSNGRAGAIHRFDPGYGEFTQRDNIFSYNYDNDSIGCYIEDRSITNGNIVGYLPGNGSYSNDGCPGAGADAIPGALLTDNGGPTFTVSLPHGSPAINSATSCPSTDQRGVPRPQGAACDVGAFESIVSFDCPSATALQNIPYTQVLQAYGGQPPYSFSRFVGTPLPAGLALDTLTGTIHGTPTNLETSTVQLRAADSSGSAFAQANQQCSITVIAAPSTGCPAVSPTQNTPVSTGALTGTGGAGGPYTFSASGLPQGLTMASDGRISGAAQQSGTFNFTISVRDKDGNIGPVNCSMTVAPATKQNQTITVTSPAPASAAYNTVFTVAATGGGSGNPIMYSAAGSCTNSGATFTMTGSAGTCTVKYNQAGNDSYNAAQEVTNSTDATKATATVTLGGMTVTYNGSPQSPTASTTPPNLNVTFTGAPQTNAGDYPLTATVTDTNYTGTATGTFKINKAAATVTVGGMTVTYNGSPQSPTAATTPANLNVTFSGAPQTNAGDYPLTATVTDTNYTGTATGTFKINKAAATVTLGGMTVTYNGSPQSPTASTTPPNLNVTFTGAPQTNAGDYPLTATISDTNYTGTATGTFKINKAAATVTLSGMTVTYNGSPQSPTASTTPPNLNVTFNGAPQTNAGDYPVTATVSDTNYTGTATGTFKINKAAATVTLGGMTVTYNGSPQSPTTSTTPANLNVIFTGAPQTNAGDYPLTATVNDTNYTGTATGTFKINKAAATVTLSGMTVTYNGSPQSPTASTTPPNLNVTFIGAPQTNAGDYPLTATVTDTNYTGTATGTFKINKAALTVTLSNMTVTYNGSPQSPIASTTPPNLNVTFTGAPQTNAGDYPLTATVTDTNYTGTATGTFKINKAALTITAQPKTKLYLAPLPAFTVQYSGLQGSDGPSVLSGSLIWTTTATQTSPIGNYPISCSGLTSSNYIISWVGSQLTVSTLPVSAAVTLSSTSVQYSDKLTINISIPNPGGVSPATGMNFKIGSVDLGTAALSLNSGNYTGSVTSPQLMQAPGPYTITGTFVSPDADYVLSYAPALTLTITAEDARSIYTGPAYVNTPSVTSYTATIPLSFTIQDITAVGPFVAGTATTPSSGDQAYDTWAGNINNATVKIIDGLTNTTMCATATLGVITAGDTSKVTATCSFVASVPTSGANAGFQTYAPQVVLAGSYADANAVSEQGLLTVALPLTSNFVSGGGSIVESASAGLLPGALGSKSQYGLSVKYNKSGTSLQGNAYVTIRSTAVAPGDPCPADANGYHVYRFKSNSITSLTVQTSTSPSTATLVGGASIQDITSSGGSVCSYSVDGGATLQITMTDKGSAGDTIGIAIWQAPNKGGNLWFSSNWAGGKTTELPLANGSLSVR